MTCSKTDVSYIYFYHINTLFSMFATIKNCYGQLYLEMLQSGTFECICNLSTMQHQQPMVIVINVLIEIELFC